ncbi:hypothetical protein GGR58DRAFT_17324 [Xylaria digitata]|nr:hypothetical protein GGR58DRAFT_17324 [Xylaria digitata]
MASNGATGSITDRVTQILTAFEAIDTVETREEPGESQLTWLQTISDQLSKFKLWAGNIGAHRTGRSSLDYRLRDSSHLQIQVMRLLDDLITSLNEVHSILSGETIPWDQDSGEVDDLDDELKDLLMNEDFEFDSELSQLTKEIADAIGNLLRLSISLRNPAPHDRFMSTEYAKARYFEANDKALTEAKFPRASQTLVTRLGQALSQRRQYFRYRESHHEKLAHGLFNSGRSEAGAQSEIASSIPQAMKDPGAAPTFRGLDEDERSDTGFSQTSFATTAPDSGSLRIPPLPKKTLDGPFECPFCFMSISVSSTHQWKKHVFADLRPYVCLAEDCPVASREYGRRHEWMNHTLQNHWKTWECPYQCGSEHTTETGLRQHVTGIHGCATEMELDAMIARYGRIRSISTSSPVECPLCKDTLESIQQYQRHVGRHQVDLALFALPKIDNDDDDELDEEIEDQGTITSGSYSEALSQDIPPTALAEATETIDESTLVDNMTPPQPNLPARSEVPRFSKYNVNPDYSEAGERVRFTLAHYNKRNFGPEMYYPDETTASVTGEREQGARTREFEQLDVLKNISTDSKDERVHTKGHEYTNEPFINIKAIRPLSGEELSLPIQTTELPTPSPSTSKRVVDDRGTLSDYKPESTQRYPAEMTKAMLVEKEAREPETLEHLSDVPLMTYTSPMTLDKDWENISDLAERRRIQNRIAQRNYRVSSLDTVFTLVVPVSL